MKICGGFGSSIYNSFFVILELISIIIIFFYYLINIINLWNNPINSYDKIDLILIYLSGIQLVLFFLRLCEDYNIFSVLILINKFSQNLMICSLLMIIILGKYSSSKAKIINYFLITLLVADILLFLIGINDKDSFEKSDAESLFNVIIAFICIIINVIIAYKSYLFKVETNNKINENLNENKISALINYNDNDNNIDKNDENNEGDFFNTILNQHLSNAITILSVYFYILIPFLISYFIEIILYFFFSSNNGNGKEEDIIDNNYNNSDNDNDDIDNDINNNINLIINKKFKNNINDTCAFVQDSKNGLSFGNLLICFIFFILRDFLPYFITYLMFFYYKLKYHRRFSF